jgi:uncharacterized repeat protein (TIGR03843 family)
VGRVPWSSNATFLVEVRAADSCLHAIYKPTRGERPLWDFPRGLWRREVAAYELAHHLGWDLVPETVGRPDGPLGPGSLQRWVDANEEDHYFTLLERPEHQRALRTIAAFDLVANNADRKGGHVLAGPGGQIWAIDHGLCFHAQGKLRTVMWDFAGEKVPDELLDALAPLAAGDIPGSLDGLLDEGELAALVARARRLRKQRRYPAPTGRWPYPWPLV